MCNVKGDTQIPEDVESCLAKAWVTDPDSLQGPPECARILTKYMKDHWQYVFQHWDEIATTKGRKWVLLNVCESLDPENYMGFLETIRELRKKGKISPDMFETASIMPGSANRKEAFLALNYRHPRVQAYIQSIRSLLPQTDESYLNDIASGQREGDWKEQYSRDKISTDDLLLAPKK